MSEGVGDVGTEILDEAAIGMGAAYSGEERMKGSKRKGVEKCISKR